MSDRRPPVEPLNIFFLGDAQCCAAVVLPTALSLCNVREAVADAVETDYDENIAQGQELKEGGGVTEKKMQ